MGTVKYTGPVASFHCPTNAEIRSLKVHFSPKQEGSGDPSPENVREIVGWDGVEQYYSGKNIGHIVGYSATTLDSPYNNKVATNAHGTTLSTVEPERSIIITQSQAPEISNISHYKNGYMVIELDNLRYNETYDISFKVTNITSNPLNATLQNLGLGDPNGTRRGPTEVQNNVLIYKNFPFKQNNSRPNEMDFDLRVCGMSFTLSDFMVTPAGMNDGIYEPYTQKRIVKWNQWLPPLTDENWQAYNASNTDVQFEDGVATSTWLNNTVGYNASIRTKTGILQKNKEIWYVSYMLKTSMGGGSWGVEYNGGLQNTLVNEVDADVWTRCSSSDIYWRGTRNYVYISYYRTNGEHTGMVAQVKSPLFINLTQMFGLGNEPTKEEFEEQCALNGIDLTSALPYDEGSLREWKTGGALLKNDITFPILGKNKFNINASFAEPNNTALTGSRVFQPYTYCLGLTAGNSYSPDKITNCSITNNTLTFTTTNTSYGVFFAIPSLYGTYRLTYTGENVSPTIVRYDNEGKISYSGSSIDSQGIIAIGPGVTIAGVLFKSVTANTPTTISNFQLEEGITATEYEEFNPNHTVYGGWVDLITGEVQEEWIYAECNDKTLWEEMTNNTCDFYYTYSFTERERLDTSYQGLISSSFLIDNTKNVYMRWVGTGSYKVGIRNRTTSYTLTDIQQMAENGDISICYQIATPNTYHIAPIQLQTFLGQNNVWSNADYVEVEYDLHETQDILARKQFIIANQPHIAKPAAALMQTFTTDVPAPLKECKAYFKPIQDLHGYDNPWPAGGGRNIFHVTAQSQTSKTGVVFTVNSDGSVKAVGNPSISTALDLGTIILPAGTYKIQGGISGAAYLNIPRKVNSYGGAASFTIAEGGETITPRIYITANTEVNGTFYPMIKASSDNNADWAPYENICPIEGWTGCEVYRTGKNLLDEVFLSDLANYPIAGNYGYWYTDPILLELNTTYKFSFATPQTYETTRYWAVKVYDDAYADINDAGTVRYLVNNKVTADWSITTGAQGAIRFAVYGGQATLDDIWNNTFVQLELGSTATEYEPYSGTTIPITFPATTNLFNEQWEQGNIEVGNDAGSSTCMRSNFINVNPSTSYYLYTPRENNVFVFEYLEDGTYANKVNSVLTSHTFTTGSTTKKIRIVDRNSGTETVNTGINYPATITYYEPYGTIYGGYVDLVTGEVVAEYVQRIYDGSSDESWALSGDDTYVCLQTDARNDIRNIRPICDKFYMDPTYATNYRIRPVGNKIYANTVAEWREWLAQNPIQVVYELAEPIHYSITPTQLKTLRGTNKIWSNANDNITLSYWTH